MADIILSENQFNFLRKVIKDEGNEPILEFARVGFAGKFEIYKKNREKATMSSASWMNRGS